MSLRQVFHNRLAFVKALHHVSIKSNKKIFSNVSSSGRVLLISSSTESRTFSTFNIVRDKVADSLALSKKGEQAFANMDYAQALKYYSQARELSVNPFVILEIAKCYERLNDTKSAFHEYRTIIRYYEEVLDDKQRQEMPAFQKYYVLALIGAGYNNYFNDDKSLEYWTKASKFKNIPSHLLGNSLVAGYYYQKGNYREAVHYYTESNQELQGTNSNILNDSYNYFFKGMCHMALNEPEIGLQDFSKIIKEYRGH